MFPALKELGCKLRFLDDHEITPNQIVRAFRSKKKNTFDDEAEELRLRLCEYRMGVRKPQDRERMTEISELNDCYLMKVDLAPYVLTLATRGGAI